MQIKHSEALGKLLKNQVQALTTLSSLQPWEEVSIRPKVSKAVGPNACPQQGGPQYVKGLGSCRGLSSI